MTNKQQNTAQVNIPQVEEDLQEDEFAESYDPNEEIDYTQDNDGQEIKKLSSKVKLSKNGMLIALLVVSAIIAFVLFTGKLPIPKINLGGMGDGDSGVASGILGSYDEASEESKSDNGKDSNADGSAGDDITTLIIRDLRDYYPTYSIERDEENQQIVAVGTMEDGQSHKMIMDYEGNIIEELIGESAVNEDGTLAESKTQEQTSDSKSDTVQVSLSEYNKYHLSKEKQNFVEEQPTEGDEFSYTPSVTTTNERLIVEYERLPIKGTTPMVYSRVLETGEEIIFAVTLRQYANLGTKGTTVIEVKRSEGYNVKTIDQVILVKWQD